MFWNYKMPALILVTFCFVFIHSCKSNNETFTASVVDTTQINTWKKNYDSLSNKFYSSKENKFLVQAGYFADSILSQDKFLFKNSILRTLFLDILFFRALDLNDLKNHVKSRELLDRYNYLYAENKLEKPDYLAYAQATLANIYSRYGDYKKAVLLLQQSLEYYSGQKKEEEMASCIFNLSIPFKELQRFDEAASTLQKIFQLNSIGPKRKAKACIELADNYTRQGKLNEAEIQIKEAKQFLKLMPLAPDRTETYALAYGIEANWLLANKRPLAALNAYRQSIDSNSIVSENIRNREVGKLLISMGKALEQLHQYDSALDYYNRALYCVANIDTLDLFSLPKQKEIYAENTIAEALYARANCIINSGVENTTQLENAVSCFKLAFETENKLLQGFSYDESRMYMLEQTRKQTEKAMAVCYRLYKKTTDSRWADEAFLFAERNKAFVLAESIRRNTAASMYLQNDSLYEKAKLLRSNLAWIEVETGKQNFAGIPDTALMKALTATRQKTEEELLAAENNIRIKNPQYLSQITNKTDITATALLNKTLTSSHRLIEYFTGDSVQYVFSAEKNKPLGFYELPSAAKKNADGFLHYFSDRNLILADPAGYAAAANSLYKLLLEPYITKSNSPLLIIPDGFIAYIPIDALLTDSTTSGNIASFPFLIKQQETYYAFSCRTLLEQGKYENTAVDNPLMAFAPVFAKKERGLSPLLHSIEELEAIKKFYPKGKFYTNSNATLNQFETNSANASIIHLATHAGSGVGLGMAGIEFFDSTLYLNSIYTMPLKARLVILSGCETGTGSINKTEGLMSLSRGFSYAGTENVIGSLWQTEDNTSAEIFRNFYSNLADDNFSTALHKAKLSVINNSTVASASPYFWSCYMYIGSPAENIKQQTGKWVKWISLAGGLLLIAIIYFIIKRRSIKINPAVF